MLIFFCFNDYDMVLFFLFIYLLTASGLSCSMWDLSLQRAGFSLVVAHGLQSTGAL